MEYKDLYHTRLSPLFNDNVAIGKSVRTPPNLPPKSGRKSSTSEDINGYLELDFIVIARFVPERASILACFMTNSKLSIRKII